jgi:hypothetical protein
MPDTLEGTALAIRDETAPSIGDHKPMRYSLPELRQVGEIMFASGMFKDLKSVQQAMVKLLAGAELGYGPFQSLRAFHVIEGKPVETSGEITARIKRSGKYRMESYFVNAVGDKLDPIRTKASETHGCVVLISEKRDSEWFALEPTVFTKDDAATAGLLGKDVWRKYLRDMLFSRTVTAAARRHCADIFGGPIYTPEELGANVTMDAEGGEIVDVTPKPSPPAEPPPEAPKTLTPDEIEAAKLERRRISTLARCSELSISDDVRHKITESLFGEGVTSSYALDYPQLGMLRDELKAYVEAKIKDESELEAWLIYRADLRAEATA